MVTAEKFKRTNHQLEETAGVDLEVGEEHFADRLHVLFLHLSGDVTFVQQEEFHEKPAITENSKLINVISFLRVERLGGVKENLMEQN